MIAGSYQNTGPVDDGPSAVILCIMLNREEGSAPPAKQASNPNQSTKEDSNKLTSSATSHFGVEKLTKGEWL